MRILCSSDFKTLSLVEKLDRAAILWGVVRGRYHVVGKDIVEPIEVYDNQEDAHTRMMVEARRDTRFRYKLTMNADIVDD